MITTVTLNPAIDKSIYVNSVEIGGLNRVINTNVSIGGKGINVAKTINKLGSSVRAIGFLGYDNKDIFEKNFRYNHLDNIFYAVKGKTRINIKVVNNSNKQITEFNEKGFDIDSDMIDELKSLIKDCDKDSDYFVLSGSAPKNMDKCIYFDLIENIKSKEKVILDVEGDLLKEGVKASPFLIKPNLDELNRTFNINCKNLKGCITQVRDLLINNNIKITIVSNGKEGSVLVTEEDAYFANVVNVKVKNTVGAGDAMVAGFVYKYNDKKDIVDSLKYATACGAVAVTVDKQEDINKDIIERYYKEVDILKL